MKRSRRRSEGVSANSRIIPHHYADEGDKGSWFRRKVRRRETRLWRQELADEMTLALRARRR